MKYRKWTSSAIIIQLFHFRTFENLFFLIERKEKDILTKMDNVDCSLTYQTEKSLASNTMLLFIRVPIDPASRYLGLYSIGMQIKCSKSMRVISWTQMCQKNGNMQPFMRVRTKYTTNYASEKRKICDIYATWSIRDYASFRVHTLVHAVFIRNSPCEGEIDATF